MKFILATTLFIASLCHAAEAYKSDVYEAAMGGGLRINMQNRKMANIYFQILTEDWKPLFSSHKSTAEPVSRDISDGKQFSTKDDIKAAGVECISSAECRQDRITYGLCCNFREDFKGRIVLRMEFNPAEFAGCPFEISGATGAQPLKGTIPGQPPFPDGGSKQEFKTLKLYPKNGGLFAVILPENAPILPTGLHWKNNYLTVILYDFGTDKTLSFSKGNLRNLSFDLFLSGHANANPAGAEKKPSQKESQGKGFFPAHDFQTSNMIVNKAKYDGVDDTCHIPAGEAMSAVFEAENTDQDLLLTFRGVNGDHSGLPVIEMTLNGKTLIKAQTPFKRDVFDNRNDEWTTFSVLAPSSFLKKTNELVIKNHGPDWWMIEWMKYEKGGKPSMKGKNIVQIDTPPPSTDSLDSPVWQQAHPLPLLKNNTPAPGCDVRVLYDSNALYIGIRQPRSAEKNSSTKKERDANLFAGDACVETLIAPVDGAKTCYRFAGNTLGAKFDSKIDGNGENIKWNADWDFQCRENAGNLDCVMRIPFGALEPSETFGVFDPEKKTFLGGAQKWGINVRLNSGGKNTDSPGLAPAGQMLDVLLENDFARGEYRPLKIIETGNPAQNANYAVVRIKNWKAEPASCNLVLSVETPLGRKETRKTLPLGASETSEIRIDYPVLAKSGPCAMELGLYTPQNEIIHETRFHIQVPDRLSLRTDLSSYEEEETARIRICNMSTAASIKGMTGKLSIHAANAGNTLKEETLRLEADETILPVKIKDYAAGIYPVKFRLCDKNGETIAMRETRLVKKPKAEHVVKYDWNNNLILDGKTIFPLGFWCVPEDKLGFLAQQGFNTVGYTPGAETGFPKPKYRGVGGEKKIFEGIDRYMSEAQKHGLAVTGNIGHMANVLEEADFEKMVKNGLPVEKVDLGLYKKVVNAMRRYPSLLYWYPIDEPAYRDIKIDFIKKLYATVRQCDPHHPILLSDSSIYWDVSKLQFAEADLFGRHSYPIPSNSIKIISDHLDKLVEQNGDDKPILFTAQAFFNNWVKIEDTGGRNRVPTAKETRAMIYLALSRNVKGVLWWNYSQWIHPSQLVRFNVKKRGSGYYTVDELYPDLWNGMIALGRELKSIQPILQTQPIPCEISTDSPDIRLFMRRHEGRVFFFAINTSNTALKARFNNLGRNFKTARVLFEERSLACEKGSLSDTFEPFDVHACELLP
ncbi:MAG: hypothetical protein PHV34_22530 [Verrucomicrobiae bacterium]|nr:hypothetical protein [Verrucomicrobiae bacterium]